MHHYWPVLYEDHTLVPASTDPNYHLTTDLADHAIDWVRKVKSIVPDRPFFLYIAPGATHAPHQAPPDWIAKFKGVDHEMGRVVDAVKQLPNADNTLFIYIAGDNGSSAEGGLEGSLNENLFFNGFPEKWQDNLKAIDELGGPKHFNHFPSAWAHAMNAPFQWTKQVASHFGAGWPEA